MHIESGLLEASEKVLIVLTPEWLVIGYMIKGKAFIIV